MPRIYIKQEEIVEEEFQHALINNEKVDYILKNATLGRINLTSEKYYYIDHLPNEGEIFNDAWVMDYDYYKCSDDAEEKYEKDENGDFFEPYDETIYEGDGQKLLYYPKMIVFSNEGWSPEQASKVYVIVQIKDRIKLCKARWQYDDKMTNDEFIASFENLSDEKELDEFVKSFETLLYLVENLLSEEGYKKAKARDRAKNKKKKLDKNKRQAYQELAKLCVHSSYKSDVLEIIENLENYEGDEEYLTSLNYLMERLIDEEYYFIVALDLSSGGEDLEYILDKILKDNYESIIVKFPAFDEDDAIGNMTILEDFSKCLNTYDLQIGFIDTQSDEYVFFVHKLKDSTRVEELLKIIGYDYYIMNNDENEVKEDEKKSKEEESKSIKKFLKGIFGK